LTEQKRYTETEPLLLDSYNTLNLSQAKRDLRTIQSDTKTRTQAGRLCRTPKVRRRTDSSRGELREIEQGFFLFASIRVIRGLNFGCGRAALGSRSGEGSPVCRCTSCPVRMWITPAASPLNFDAKIWRLHRATLFLQMISHKQAQPAMPHESLAGLKLS